MPLHIVRDDLANMRTDAVIVPANTHLIIGGGAGEAVARIAGMDRMQRACDQIGSCPVGKAVVTPTFDFPAKMVIHAVGPVWNGGQSGEMDALFSCVSESLLIAAESGAQTIALPLLSTGAFGFPMGEAINIETLAIQRFLGRHEVDIWLVLYDRASMRIGRTLFDDIEEYIDDVYIGEHGDEGTSNLSRRFGVRGERPVQYGSEIPPVSSPTSTVAAASPMRAPAVIEPAAKAPTASPASGMPAAAASMPASGPKGPAAVKGAPGKRRLFSKRKKRKTAQEAESLRERPEDAFSDYSTGASDEANAIIPGPFTGAAEFDVFPQNLAERLEHLDESFAQTVLRLIDERGMNDVEVYKRANMSRQLFAKIRKDDGYRPTKKTACALVFALGLNREDALALLSRAGFTLSHSSKFDVIVEYFLVNGIHDIFQVNEALFAYDQPILG